MAGKLQDSLTDTPWWELPYEDQGGEIQRLVKGYKDAQSSRRTQYIRNLEAYEGRNLGGYSAHAYVETDGGSSYQNQRLRLIRSAVSSAVANTYAPQKPKPQFQTLGATWALRRKAYKLDKIVEGIFNQRQGRWINLWALMIDAAVETALQGTAVVMVSCDYTKKRIVHELIPHVDVYTDPVQGREPTDWFCRRPCSVGEAVARYGRTKKARAAIQSAPLYEWYGAPSVSRPRATKVIQLDYAWHIGTEDEPGKWAVAVNGVTVDGDDWVAPAPPFVLIQWEPHRDGPWASGIADEGLAMSEQADEIDLRLYTRELIASGEKIFYTKDSLNPQDLTINDAVVAIAVEPGAQLPTFNTPAPFSPMEMQFRDAKIRDYWDGIGISQVSAAARREQGVSSGVAIRTLNDTKAGRQLTKAQRYEQAAVDFGQQHVWRLRELLEVDKKLSIKWAGKNLLREIAVGDALDLEDSDFSLTVAPASALPHDPAGRQEMVQELFKSGLISQETTKQLMGWPDFDAELQVENAETEYVDMLIERYLDADEEDWSMGDYQAPEGFVMNKVGAIRRFASAWFRARIDQASLPTKKERAKVDFNLKLLSRYIKEMDALMQPPAPPEVPAQLPPGAMPPPGALPPGPLGAPPPMAAAPMGPQALPGVAPMPLPGPGPAPM
jgi:hypothetical protein